MSRSKKISIGFQVVNTHSGSPLSMIYAKREAARDAASRAWNTSGQTLPVGVRHVEEYVAADTSKEAIAKLRSDAFVASTKIVDFSTGLVPMPPPLPPGTRTG